MMPIWHMLASTIFSAIILFLTGSVSSAVACFAAGTLIDIDHVLDYYFYSGRLSLNISEISGFYESFGKVFVLLHSYELLFAGAIAAHIFQASLLFHGAAVGFMGHMLLDTVGYEMKPQSYFLVYRAVNGFRLEKLCYWK